MKTLLRLFSVTLLSCLSLTQVYASPIVFQFTASPGQTTLLNGSTITLQGPSDLTGANDATDLLSYYLYTAPGIVTPTTSGVVTFVGDKINGPFTYSSSNLLGGILVIADSTEKINITGNGIAGTGVTGANTLSATIGMWAVVPAATAPDRVDNLLLLLFSWLLLGVLHAKKRMVLRH